MKNYFYVLVFFLFTMSLSAQNLNKLTNAADKAKSSITTNTEQVDKQISSALLKDEDLQTQTIDFLKSNVKTKPSVLDLISKNKGGSNKTLMKSILGDKNLAKVAIDYVKNNPDLLKKAMKIVGL